MGVTLKNISCFKDRLMIFYGFLPLSYCFSGKCAATTIMGKRGQNQVSSKGMELLKQKSQIPQRYHNVFSK